MRRTAARGIIGTASMRIPSPSKRSIHQATSLVTASATASFVQSRVGMYVVNQHDVSLVAQEQLPTPQTHEPSMSWNQPPWSLAVQYGCSLCTWCGTTSKRM